RAKALRLRKSRSRTIASVTPPASTAAGNHPNLKAGSVADAGACLRNHYRSAGEDRLAVDIARRRIAADQIVPVRSVDRATDAGRRRPHHLRVVSDVFPLAGAADRRE